ncbi:MAG: trp operon repressor [Patescibacteria group bacterium]|nr:trp operon repressor [Patescibacteria group bacterium]
MPHVSRNKLSKKAEAKLIDSFNQVLTHITRGDEMVSFLDSLLTPTEKIMLAKRLAIIVLIEEGLPDSQISSILNVTRMTASKMQLFYEARGSGFKIGLKKLEELNRMESFKKFLISLAKYSVRAAGGYVKPGILD